MESTRIARKYNAKGSQVGDLMDPVRGIRDVQRRRGKTPKNHAKENLRQLRALQRQNREKQGEAGKEPAKFVMKRFQNAKARVVMGSVQNGADAKAQSQEPSAPESPKSMSPPSTKVALNNTARKRAAKIRDREAARQAAAASHSAASSNKTSRANHSPSKKPPVPKRGELARLAPRTKKNFRAANVRAADTMLPPSQDEETHKRREGFGEVPLYIQERKMEMLEKKAKQQFEEERKKGCPKGMTLLSEEERVETLSVLQKNAAETSKTLSKMPLVVETPSLIKRKAVLEQKLHEIESAISVFSRKKVYVREDA